LWRAHAISRPILTSKDAARRGNRQVGNTGRSGADPTDFQAKTTANDPVLTEIRPPRRNIRAARAIIAGIQTIKELENVAQSKKDGTKRRGRTAKEDRGLGPRVRDSFLTKRQAETGAKRAVAKSSGNMTLSRTGGRREERARLSAQLWIIRPRSRLPPAGLSYRNHQRREKAGVEAEPQRFSEDLAGPTEQPLSRPAGETRPKAAQRQPKRT